MTAMETLAVISYTLGISLLICFYYAMLQCSQISPIMLNFMYANVKILFLGIWQYATALLQYK